MPTLACRSAYVPLFLATSAFCFPEGFNNTALLDELKFKARVSHSCRLHATSYVTRAGYRASR